MAKLEDPKEEWFARLLAQNCRQYDSYKDAGLEGTADKASRLARSPRIKARILEINPEYQPRQRRGSANGNTPKGTPGTIYAFTNPAMPGLVKIGYTVRSVEERRIELSRPTGVPSPYETYRYVEVPHASKVEKIVHERLKDKHHGLEFFRCELEDVDLIFDDLSAGIFFDIRREITEFMEAVSVRYPGSTMTIDDARKAVNVNLEDKMVLRIPYAPMKDMFTCLDKVAKATQAAFQHFM
jgi:hypothetical protein